MKRNRFNFVLMFFLLNTIMGQCVAADPLVKNVVAVHAEKAESNNETSLFCEVYSPLNYLISSQSESELIWVAPEGSFIKKGQVLARQDDFYLKRKIQALELELKSTSIDVDYAKAKSERIHALAENLRAAIEVDEVDRLLNQSKIKFNLIDVQLNELNHRLEKLVHHAPADGEIGSLTAHLGEQLVIGQSILQFIPVDDNELKCVLPADFFLSNDSQDVEFVLDNKHIFRPTRKSILLDKVTQTSFIYLSIDKDLKKTFMVGQRLKLNMNSKQNTFTKIPYDALSLENNKFFVWKIEKDNTVTKMYVDLVSTDEGHAIIKSKISFTEQVVVKGKQDLTNGQKISLTGVN